MAILSIILSQAIILLHVIFYFTDSLPLFQTVFSIICHIVYLQNFSNTWPLISLTSLSFLASCALVISDHFIWFFYFARITSEARSRQYRSVQPDAPGFTEIASFFAICVWYTPLFLFLSLSANDNALPMTASKSYPLNAYIMQDAYIHSSRTLLTKWSITSANCPISHLTYPHHI